jgi:hypothetical protein
MFAASRRERRCAALTRARSSSFREPAGYLLRGPSAVSREVNSSGGQGSLGVRSSLVPRSDQNQSLWAFSSSLGTAHRRSSMTRSGYCYQPQGAVGPTRSTLPAHCGIRGWLSFSLPVSQSSYPGRREWAWMQGGMRAFPRSGMTTSGEQGQTPKSQRSRQLPFTRRRRTLGRQAG